MRTRYMTYSDAIAQRICDELDSGGSLNAICRDDGMPCEATVHRWARLDLHGFGARYQRSRPPKGGPLVYTAAVAERICDQLRTGRTLADICDDEGMPSDSAVLHWTKVDRDGFRARYRQAREIGYMAMADEIIAIADDASNDWMARRERAAWAGRRRRAAPVRPRERRALAAAHHRAVLAAVENAAAAVRRPALHRGDARGRQFAARTDADHRRAHPRTAGGGAGGGAGPRRRTAPLPELRRASEFGALEFSSVPWF